MSVDAPPSAEDARRSHSIASAVRAGITVWYALLGSIGAWAIHLVALTSLVQYSCNTGGAVWLMHLVTAVTLAMTVVALVLSARLASAKGDEASVEEGGRTRFIGLLGLVVGASNFLLIAAEGVLVLVLDVGRRCG